MTDTVEALILDLLDWLLVRDRTYEEVMDAWRTSCPRLPVWEDANDHGLIRQEEVNGHRIVRVSSTGLVLLRRCRNRPGEPAISARTTIGAHAASDGAGIRSRRNAEVDLIHAEQAGSKTGE
jgi:hypothetical protein